MKTCWQILIQSLERHDPEFPRRQMSRIGAYYRLLDGLSSGEGPQLNVVLL
jgi:hypothetical protein